MINMELLHSEVNGNTTSNLYTDYNATEIFVDGVGQLQIGPSVTKLKLYSVENVQGDNSSIIEDRIIRYHLVIPTNALLAFIPGLKAALMHNKSAIISTMTNTANFVEQTVEKL